MMPEVNNWQLGRKMTYPYAEARPKKQFTMIMDTNKCIACQTCTMGCKTTWTSGKGQEYQFWNNVESKPYGFYPTGWDLRGLELLGEQKWEADKYAGKTIFEAAPAGEMIAGWLPESEHWAQPNLGEDEPAGEVRQGTYIPGLPHSVWMFYLQRICNHCTFPGCLAACPRKAIYKRDDGFVLVDQERCRGYRECMRACPWKKILYNNTTRVAEKCIGCYPFLEQGEMNRCVTTCIGRIRLSGFKTGDPAKPDPKNPLDYLIHVRKAVLPLYPQFGPEPNVYYFPPVHVPAPYLTQMFGPGAENAVKIYKDAMAGKDPDLQGLLMLFGATSRIIQRFEVKDGMAYGYDAQDKLVGESPVREPTYIRSARDAAHGTYRSNIT